MRERDVPERVLDRITQECADELQAELGYVDPDTLERVIAEVLALMTPQAIERLARETER